MDVRDMMLVRSQATRHAEVRSARSFSLTLAGVVLVACGGGGPPDNPFDSGDAGGSGYGTTSGDGASEGGTTSEGGSMSADGGSASTGATEGGGTATSGAGESSTSGSADETSGDGGASTSGSESGSEVCAQTSSEASLTTIPVDIIFVIDNSGSMAEEIEDVEYQINANFASIIDNADPPIDYRVIMLSDFGSFNSERVCVSEPLGGISATDGHCSSIPAAPVNGARFFHHSPGGGRISSHNALCRLEDEFDRADEYGLQPNGYQQVLREEAFKYFVVVTDDRPDNTDIEGCTGGVYDDSNTVNGGTSAAAAWDTAMLALSSAHFGTAQSRKYAFHSIVALAPYNSAGAGDYGDPYPPDQPITTSECTPDAETPGTGYQGLSILTGGYRFPTCGLDYTKIFQLMAEGVIQQATVACEFPIPAPPEGEIIDLDTVVVRYTSTDGSQNFVRVADASACHATAYYVENDLITLCPAACEVVQADFDAQLDVLYGCEVDENGEVVPQ